MDSNRAEPVALLERLAEPSDEGLGHLLIRLVLEVDDVPVARAAADGADEARDRARLGILDLVQHSGDVDRAVDEPEGAAADRRDESHLIAVRELVAALDVLPVHRIQEARRLRTEVERRPHILDPHDVFELQARAPGAFPQAGEEANGHPHVLILPAAYDLAMAASSDRRTESGIEIKPVYSAGDAQRELEPP